MNVYIEPLVDELLKLWDGLWYNKYPMVLFISQQTCNLKNPTTKLIETITMVLCGIPT